MHLHIMFSFLNYMIFDSCKDRRIMQYDTEDLRSCNHKFIIFQLDFQSFELNFKKNI